MTEQMHSLDVQRHDGVVVVILAGEIDAENGPSVREELLGLGATTLILDVTQVRYLDSAGIAMLEAVRGRTALRLILTRDSIIRRTLEIAGMSQVFATYSSVDDALTPNG
jgi:anti-sigma B factor antagonist